MFSSFWTFAWSVYIRIRNILVYLVHVGDVDVELWIPNFLNQVGVSKWGGGLLPLQASRHGPTDGGDTAEAVRKADGVAAPGQRNAHAHLQHQEGVLRPKI